MVACDTVFASTLRSSSSLSPPALSIPLILSDPSFSSFSQPSTGRGGLGGAIFFLVSSPVLITTPNRGRRSVFASSALWVTCCLPTMEAVRGGTGGRAASPSSASESLSEDSTQNRICTQTLTGQALVTIATQIRHHHHLITWTWHQLGTTTLLPLLPRLRYFAWPTHYHNTPAVLHHSKIGVWLADWPNSVSIPLSLCCSYTPTAAFHVDPFPHTASKTLALVADLALVDTPVRPRKGRYRTQHTRSPFPYAAAKHLPLPSGIFIPSLPTWSGLGGFRQHGIPPLNKEKGASASG